MMFLIDNRGKYWFDRGQAWSARGGDVMPKITAVVVPLLVLLAACNSPMQRSAPLSPDYLAANPLHKEAKTGIPYFLPDTVVPITVAGDFVLLPDRKSDKPMPADYEYVINVTIGNTKQVADPNAAMLLEYVLESGTDDVFSLQVGSNGLLSNVKSTSTDRTGDILLKLVELAKEAIKLPAFFTSTSVGSTDDNRRAACYERLQKMSVTSEVNLSEFLRVEAAFSFLARRVKPVAGGWDYATSTVQEQELADEYARYLWSLKTSVEPFSLTATVNAYGAFQNAATATDALVARQVALLNRSAVASMQRSQEVDIPDRPVSAIRIGGKGLFPVPGSQSSTPTYVRPEQKSYRGVVFRTMVPRRLSIAADTQGLKFGPTCSLRNVAVSQNDATFMVADPAHTFVADTTRALLVQKKVDLTVSDGVLTQIDVDKKSEMLAIVSLPVDILKAIASIPAELLNVKVTQLGNEQKLTQAQIDLLKAQIELIKQNKALLDAQKGSQ